jgi:hypothetical protein
MAKEIRTEIDINASAQKIWDVLTDREGWARWNPVLVGLDGPMRVGAKHRLEIKVGGRLLKTPVRLVEHGEPRALSWRGGVPGLIKAHHGFRIEEVGESKCHFVHYERFEGPLAFFIGPLLDHLLLSGYGAMNAALKVQAEK